MSETKKTGVSRRAAVGGAVPGAGRYDVPSEHGKKNVPTGSGNTPGNWGLVIHPKSGIVLHYGFEGKYK